MGKKERREREDEEVNTREKSIKILPINKVKNKKWNRKMNAQQITLKSTWILNEFSLERCAGCRHRPRCVRTHIEHCTLCCYARTRARRWPKGGPRWISPTRGWRPRRVKGSIENINHKLTRIHVISTDAGPARKCERGLTFSCMVKIKDWEHFTLTTLQNFIPQLNIFGVY